MMRRFALIATVGLSCAGCGAIGPAPTELAHIDVRGPDAAGCRTWTAQAQVDLTQESLVGRGCPLPGGGWSVTEGTTEHPGQFQQQVTAAVAAAYPWRSGPPVGISTGRSVVYYPFDEQGSDGPVWFR